jgi:hypothetical protein
VPAAAAASVMKGCRNLKDKPWTILQNPMRLQEPDALLMKLIIVLTIGLLVWMCVSRHKAPRPSSRSQDTEYQTAEGVSQEPENKKTWLSGLFKEQVDSQQNAPVIKLTETEKNELKELVGDSNLARVEIASPLTELGKKTAAYKGKLNARIFKIQRAVRHLKERMKNVGPAALTFLILAAAAILVLWFVGCHSIVKFVSNRLLWFSKFLFASIAIMSLYFLYTIHSNLWEQVGYVPLWFTAGIFCAAAAGIRLEDNNRPFLETLHAGLALPLIQAYIVTFGTTYLVH